jgi:flagellar FliL protein
MARDDDDLDLDIETQPKSGGGMKKILLIVIIGMVMMGTSVGVTVMLVSGGNNTEQVEGEEDEEEADSNAADEDEEEAKAKKKKKKKKKKKRKKKKKKKKKKARKVKKDPHYLELGKPIVVNLDGSSGVRFLQVSVALMTYSEADLEKVKKHMPVIRHNLVLLFSSQNFTELQTIEGKKKLQSSALSMIRQELEKLTGDPLVEAVYMPSIVGQ